MNERTWARHANPWSGWTRVAAFPMLVLAIWSRAWIGGWCLLPVAALVLFMAVNPRLFAPPRSGAAWMSRATFGERIFLRRREVPIPQHHETAALLLAAASALGVVVLGFGLAVLDVRATACGYVLAAGAKLWFADRMVRLYEDMRTAGPGDAVAPPAAGSPPPQ